jgi:hypothetical protein
LNELQQRHQLDTSKVDDIVLGCVTPIGDQGGDIAKTAAIAAGWNDDVAGVQINRFCASGLEGELGSTKSSFRLGRCCGCWRCGVNVTHSNGF